MKGVLEGVRVLDFGRYIAGPYCAAMLGDMGAEVIRVEKTGGSEDRFLVPVAEDGAGGLFLQMNRNKRCLTLDPMKPEGREVVAKLVATADVVVANLPAQSLEAMGLDYESLCAIKPDIILAANSAFGPSGPYSGRVGFDGVGQAMNGAMYMTGPPEEPMRAFVPYVDFGTALYSAFGTMAALMARRETGRGQQVETCLLHTALSFANSAVIEQAINAPNRVASGNRGQHGAPGDCFQTKDGWILVAVVGQPLFKRWARLMGEDHWLEDPRFAEDQDRGDNGEVISERMAVWCGERTTEQCLAELDEARVPAGPVLSQQQVLDHPQIQAGEFLKGTEYPGLPKPAPVVDTPVRLSATPGGIRRRAPTLGEDTDAILQELGYGAEAIAALREKAVV